MSTVTTGEPKDLARLYAKIAAVTAAMKRVPKNGKNNFQNYKYATESDIVDTLRAAMAEEKIAIIPAVDSTERIEHKNEKLGPITRLFMHFTVACGDTGATISMSWIGDGQDPADKGLYKAYTGAEKYFLMKLFMVATGDDPEQDEPQMRHQEPQSRPAPVQTINQAMRKKAEVTTEDAKAKFYANFGPALAHPETDATWSDVRRQLGMAIDEPEPTTVEGWRFIWKVVDAALKEEAKAAA